MLETLEEKLSRTCEFGLLSMCLVTWANLVKLCAWLRISTESWWILSVSVYANSKLSVVQWMMTADYSLYEQFLIALQFAASISCQSISLAAYKRQLKYAHLW